MDAIGLVAQPIRPMQLSGERFDRLPWFEVLLRPSSGRDVQSVVDEAYSAGDAPALDFAILSAAASLMRRHCHYSVNISIATLAEANASTRIMSVLGQAGIRPERVVLELVGREYADEALWRCAARAIAMLRRQLGVSFALDDVVESDRVSHLACLAPASIRYGKLDCRLTSQLCEQGALPAEVEDVLRFLGRVELVAEGVETQSTWCALHEALPRIRYWQGFYDGGLPLPLLPADDRGPPAFAEAHAAFAG